MTDYEKERVGIVFYDTIKGMMESAEFHCEHGNISLAKTHALAAEELFNFCLDCDFIIGDESLDLDDKVVALLNKLDR